MERANHISIAMLDDVDSNGTARSKVDAAVTPSKQPCGSTVSFHNIHYKVQLKGGTLCRRKSSPKEILVDLRLVLHTVQTSSELTPAGSLRNLSLLFSLSWIWFVMDSHIFIFSGTNAHLIRMKRRNVTSRSRRFFGGGWLSIVIRLLRWLLFWWCSHKFPRGKNKTFQARPCSLITWY